MKPKNDGGKSPYYFLESPCRFLRSLLNSIGAMAAVVAPLVLFPATGIAADQAAPVAESASDDADAPHVISPADHRCLECHGSTTKTKQLADGAKLALQVPPELYLKSGHSTKGCAACHTNIDADLDKHAKKTAEIASKRSFSLAMTQTCGKCHSKRFDQWETSVHAALVRSGSAAAPICTDCHNPHAIIESSGAAIEQTPCRNCHGKIFSAFIGSVHGKSLLESSDSESPDCAGCHTAHSVKAISDGIHGSGPVQACLGCHKNAPEKHEAWLPNVSLHFETVACPACHSPKAERRVDLMLINSKGVAEGADRIGVPLFEANANSNGEGIDAQRLWSLMQSLDRSGLAPKTALRGRLDVANGVQAHQMAKKSEALSDCKVCHSAGSQAFQKVTISLVGPQGLRVGYDAKPEVLNSAFSVDSVRGFYAIGGTRIKLLDILLALAIISGLGIAFGHVFIGWMFKRFGFYHPHHERTDPPTDGDRPRPAA